MCLVVLTWNTNRTSMRDICGSSGLAGFTKEPLPDVICLQEVLGADDCAEPFTNQCKQRGFDHAYWAFSEHGGGSGVGIMLRRPTKVVSVLRDIAGRWIVVRCCFAIDSVERLFEVWSIYAPINKKDRREFFLKWRSIGGLPLLTREQYSEDRCCVFVCGDLQFVAPDRSSIDKIGGNARLGSEGFYEWNAKCSVAGLVDTFLVGAEEKVTSPADCWTWENRCKHPCQASHVRKDYIYCTRSFARSPGSLGIIRRVERLLNHSDHCGLLCGIRFKLPRREAFPGRSVMTLRRDRLVTDRVDSFCIVVLWSMLRGRDGKPKADDTELDRDLELLARARILRAVDWVVTRGCCAQNNAELSDIEIAIQWLYQRIPQDLISNLERVSHAFGISCQ